MRMIRWISVLSLAALSSCSEMTLRPVTYNGWKNCYSLSNGRAQAVIVPSIGRMMSYRLCDGRNVLDVNPDRVGFTPPSDPDSYIFYGGMYTWISPQIHWVERGKKGVWVGADPRLDHGPFRVTRATPIELTMVSPVSPVYGLQESRTYQLVPGTSRLKYTVSLRNVGPYPVRWGIWNLSAVRPEGVAFFRLPNGRRDLIFPSEPKKAKKYFNSLLTMPASDLAAVDMRKFFFESSKLFARPGSEFLAYRLPEGWFIRNFKADPNAFHSDWQSQVEIYGQARLKPKEKGKVTKIFELEVLSPDYVIRPNETVTWTETMTIVEDQSPIAEDLRREAAKLPGILKKEFPKPPKKSAKKSGSALQITTKPTKI